MTSSFLVALIWIQARPIAVVKVNFGLSNEPCSVCLEFHVKYIWWSVCAGICLLLFVILSFFCYLLCHKRLFISAPPNALHFSSSLWFQSHPFHPLLCLTWRNTSDPDKLNWLCCITKSSFLPPALFWFLFCSLSSPLPQYDSRWWLCLVMSPFPPFPLCSPCSCHLCGLVSHLRCVAVVLVMCLGFSH